MAADLESWIKISSPLSPTIDLVEQVCDRLGTNHQPYAWIESHCDDIVEENAGECLSLCLCVCLGLLFVSVTLLSVCV